MDPAKENANAVTSKKDRITIAYCSISSRFLCEERGFAQGDCLCVNCICFILLLASLECGKPVVPILSHLHIPLDSDFRSLPLPSFDRPISRSLRNLAVEFSISFSDFFLWAHSNLYAVLPHAASCLFAVAYPSHALHQL